MVTIEPLFLANDNEFGWTKTISFSNHSCYIVGTFLKINQSCFCRHPPIKAMFAVVSVTTFPTFVFSFKSQAIDRHNWRGVSSQQIPSSMPLLEKAVVSCFWLGGGRQDLDRYPPEEVNRYKLLAGWVGCLIFTSINSYTPNSIVLHSFWA